MAWYVWYSFGSVESFISWKFKDFNIISFKFCGTCGVTNIIRTPYFYLKILLKGQVFVVLFSDINFETFHKFTLDNVRFQERKDGHNVILTRCLIITPQALWEKKRHLCFPDQKKNYRAEFFWRKK